MYDHKRISFIKAEKKAYHTKKILNITSLEQSLEKLIRKNYLTLVHKDTYRPTHKFYAKYRKILALGEATIKIQSRFPMSKNAASKLDAQQV